ncbi:hypothetical protein RFI_27283 [Reticulomyxa filosa]|uniref:Uncharacterized protein n=1 Tax=Reticulomyxa filosa TaxID=46433 RepID=X6M9D4_RETFI|nr:hypothetical protein RFI_27283 [Reticulomyxa filosa]|eukprot:ETO10092.1 hypothetical protein RFI_27283 [Reticulomyxa filosa]
MANLIKAALHRNKIQQIAISVDKSNDKIAKFLKQFEFRPLHENNSNKDENEQKTHATDSNSNTCTFVLSLAVLRDRLQDASKHDEESTEVKSDLPKNAGGKKSSD